jgi:hypothetical protein
MTFAIVVLFDYPTNRNRSAQVSHHTILLTYIDIRAGVTRDYLVNHNKWTIGKMSAAIARREEIIADEQHGGGNRSIAGVAFHNTISLTSRQHTSRAIEVAQDKIKYLFISSHHSSSYLSLTLTYIPACIYLVCK